MDEKLKEEAEHGSEEEAECDLKNLSWLVAYRLPEKFGFSQLALDEGTKKDSSDVETNLTSTSSAGEIVPFGSSKKAVQKNRSIREPRLPYQNCSTACWLYRILAFSFNNALTFDQIASKFVSLNPRCTHLSMHWKSAIRSSLLFSGYFTIDKAKRPNQLLWRISNNAKLYRSAVFGSAIRHRCLPDNISQNRRLPMRKVDFVAEDHCYQRLSEQQDEPSETVNL